MAVVNTGSIPLGQTFSASIPFQLITPTNYVRMEGSSVGSLYISKRINTIPYDKPFNQVGTLLNNLNQWLSFDMLK